MTQADLPVQADESAEDRALRKLAGIAGWAVMYTTNGEHAATSLHKTADATGGIGRAVDLADRAGPGWDSSQLLSINEQVLQLLPLSMIAELIYAGPGGICVKNGRIIPGLAVYGAATMAEHHNHVHLGVIRGFTYNGPEAAPMADDPNIPNSQARIVAAFPTPTGKGYWIITADGAVFAFGDAEYHGRIEAPTS